MPKAWKKSEDIKFVSGNPQVEETEGIVHLLTKQYKDYIHLTH